jgi:hypothetical protein
MNFSFVLSRCNVIRTLRNVCIIFLVENFNCIHTILRGRNNQDDVMTFRVIVQSNENL